MDCNRCGTALNLQNINNNEWKIDSEEFIIKCPICELEKHLILNIFKNKHISSQYLKMIALDTKEQKKEKYIDYIPEEQRKLIFDHLKTCEICSNKIEKYRLALISKEILINRNTYDFFILQAVDIFKELNNKEVFWDKNGINKFLYNDKFYNLKIENLFNSNIEKDKIQYFYILEDNSENGIVSFIILKEKVILEKIWLKSQNCLNKEKKNIENLKKDNIRILSELMHRP